MVDFKQVKLLAPIEEVARNYLNLPLVESNGQLRTACPVCAPDDPRSLIVTPEMAVALDLGVSLKGTHTGKIVIPLYKDGAFLCYVGVDSLNLPKKWRSP